MLRFPTNVFCALILFFSLSACGGGTPSAPANTTSWAFVGIAGASRQITLSWTSADKAAAKAAYNIYWSTTPGVTKKNGSKITGVTSPYLHTGLVNGTMYYYVVTAVIDSQEGPESLEVATAPKAALPSVPTGITVAPSNNSVQIKIDRTGAATTTKFHLYWSKSSDLKDSNKITNAFGSNSVFQHAALTNGTTYYYAVTAESPDGESVKSRTVAATPLADSIASNYVVDTSPARIAAPNAITAVAASQLTTLTWNMPANKIPTVFDPSATPTMTPAISGYMIYWSTSFISDRVQATKIYVAADSKAKLPMTYEHNTGLVNMTPYYYLVTAVANTDINGNPLKTATGQLLTFESPISSQVSVVPETKRPTPLVGFSAVSGMQKISLAWTKSTVANTTYNVYASNTAPAYPQDLITPSNIIATTTAATYLHTGLQNGATYYYVVTATTTGESEPSAVIAVSLW